MKKPQNKRKTQLKIGIIKTDRILKRVEILANKFHLLHKTSSTQTLNNLRERRVRSNRRTHNAYYNYRNAKS